MNYVESVCGILVSDREVDIVVPDVKMENSMNNWSNFNFYTSDLILDPQECILNSLNKWMVHGWFICRKSIFLKSYEEYYTYNKECENYLNNDEVITRLNFKNSKIIKRVNVEYFYCFNSSSTTKKINDKKYLMIYNAIILSKIFYNDQKIYSKIVNEIISILWDSTIYMIKNRKHLKNFKQWKLVLNMEIKKIGYLKHLARLNIVKKVQFTFLKFIYLFGYNFK